MKTQSDITAFIGAQPEMMQALSAVETLGLPDCWIAAGFIRNAVWDFLHGRPYTRSSSDVDVVYFDKQSAALNEDSALEQQLNRQAPGLAWSVKNQARMHVGNDDAPYLDTASAMTHWPETCTAIGARLQRGTIEVIAPLGLDDLLQLRVRPSPRFRVKIPVYRTRIAAKNWSAQWPLLDMEE